MGNADRNLTERLPGGGVAFTDRGDGNMSSVGGDGRAHGAANRERLRLRLGLAGLARGYQVHGTRVARVSAGTDPATAPEGLERADGQATAAAGVGVMVLAADCLPVALGAQGAVAVVHAGWRGLAAGVLEEGVAALRAAGGLGPVTAVVGPGARACCYEVGPEVHAALGSRAAGRGNVDLAAVAGERLLAAGVQELRVIEACTICDERFFSHRREGERAGRQVAVAWLS